MPLDYLFDSLDSNARPRSFAKNIPYTYPTN